MTMQFVLPTKGNGFVLASDTKIRTTEKEFTDKPDVALGLVNSSKIRFSKRHDLAVALAGWGPEEGGDPAQELADYLAAEESVPEPLSPLVREWGSQLFQKKYPGQKHDFPSCTLLVVNPRAEYCALLKLRVCRDSDDQVSTSYLFNGNENNSAIFWPEYFRCDKTTYDMQTATRIAAFTILMASELNPYGVGGLEIWQYNGAWISVPPAEIQRLIARFQEFQESIRVAIQP